ncbi:hypothetical protein ACTXT7_011255, partial [Hymenolepis weldensis]
MSQKNKFRTNKKRFASNSKDLDEVTECIFVGVEKKSLWSVQRYQSRPKGSGAYYDILESAACYRPRIEQARS